jgi:hypothetical protein
MWCCVDMRPCIMWLVITDAWAVRKYYFWRSTTLKVRRNATHNYFFWFVNALQASGCAMTSILVCSSSSSSSSSSSYSAQKHRHPWNQVRSCAQHRFDGGRSSLSWASLSLSLSLSLCISPSLSLSLSLYRFLSSICLILSSSSSSYLPMWTPHPFRRLPHPSPTRKPPSPKLPIRPEPKLNTHGRIWWLNW